MCLNPIPLEPQPDEPHRPTQPVDGRLGCARCGYELAGLDRKWRCPECGLPVGLSLEPNAAFLTYGPYLVAMFQGARISVLTLLARLLVVPAGLLAVFQWGSGGPYVFSVMWLGFVCCDVAALVGWWLLTTSPPGEGLAQSLGAKVVRVCAVVIAVLTASGLNPWLVAMYQTATPVFAPASFLAQDLVTGLVFVGIGARLGLVWALGSVLAEIGERAMCYPACEAARGLPSVAFLMLFTVPAIGLAGLLGSFGYIVLLFNALVVLIAWATLLVSVNSLNETLSVVVKQHRHAAGWAMKPRLRQK